MRVGFPHSDILGSKLVCQLPEAYRRLPRPSSPVIAKASTTCTCSLDPIALTALPRSLDSNSRAIGDRVFEQESLAAPVQSQTQCLPGLAPKQTCIFRIVKEQPINPRQKRINKPGACLCDSLGGGERDRTDDLLLAKQALSQLSYTPD